LWLARQSLALLRAVSQLSQPELVPLAVAAARLRSR